MTEKRRLLIADDDSDIRTIVSGALSAPEWEVLEACDGLEALKICEILKPDLLLLDIMMPGMDGNEVCRRLKTSQHGRFMPIIMLTARDDIQNKVDSFELGADDYVTKPFNYQELKARVKAFLRIRDLNLALHNKNLELQVAQEKILQQERQLVVGQLAGTAAHQLGQPLSAIMLNCHLLTSVKEDATRFQQVLQAIKDDAQRMAEMIESLKSVDAGKTEGYFGSTQILGLPEKDKK